MGAARKLQNEIDAVLKKVKEGVTTFDDTHEKLTQQQAQPQREKLVASLKDQIKKLQKDRDKIKTWASGNEVRDKKNLGEARAMIERRMEKFKDCEKELKVKDFSKVGLEKGAKLDPKQAAVDERREWIRNCVDQIDSTVEINEAEMDSILAGVKRGKEPPARVARIQARNAIHKKHTERLEQVLRALDNEVISVEQVDSLRDGIDIYLEDGNNSGDDDCYSDVDALYDEEILRIIDNVDVHVPIITERVAPRVPDHTEKLEKKSREKDRESEKSRKEEREKEKDKSLAVGSRSHTVGKGFSTHSLDDKANSQAPVIKDPPPPPPPRTAREQPILLATQQAAASPHTSQQSDSSTVLSARVATAPPTSAWTNAVGASNQVQSATLQASTSNPADASPVTSVSTPSGPPMGSQSPAAQPAGTTTSAAPSSLPPGLVSRVSNSGETVTRNEARVPAALAKLPPLEPGGLMMTLQDKRPNIRDGVWLRYPCARRFGMSSPCPPSYPSVPPAILDSPRFWSRITRESDLELFYIFYLSPGTQYQYLAACELRKRNWRFHKEEKAWFLRSESPLEQTNTYEKGDYVYFDSPISNSENPWVLRLKKDFKIEYSQVENDTWCEAAYSVMSSS